MESTGRRGIYISVWRTLKCGAGGEWRRENDQKK